VRRNVDTQHVAYKTSLTDAGREWFVMTPGQGGHYTDGIREGIGQWPLLQE
jgi:hypothetical protein